MTARSFDRLSRFSFVAMMLVAAPFLGNLGCAAESDSAIEVDSTEDELTTSALTGEWEWVSGSTKITNLTITTKAAQTLGGFLKGVEFKAVGDTGVRCITTPCPSTFTGVGVARSTKQKLTLASFDKPTADFAAILGDYYYAVGTDGLLRLTKYGTQTREVMKRVVKVKSCGGRGGATCAAGEFCDREPAALCGRADAPGVCTKIPTNCTKEYAPVCGCDGNTYANRCMARKAGVGADSLTACTPPAPVACGTRGTAQCGDGQFCDREPSANCGRADAPGVCTDLPEVCTMEFAPVCGCDGVTYSNRCQARAAGVGVDYLTACH